MRIFGQELPVRADIYTISGLSAHADRAALLAWLKGFRRPPGCCFVVHGEGQTAAEFAAAIRQLGWSNVDVPEYGEYVDLT